jgi:exonuclease VII large subunit
VLERGYAVLLREDGRAVRAAAEAPVGSSLRARLAEGRLDVIVQRREEQ